MSSTLKKLAILMLSPDPRVQGGVTAFAATVKKNLENCTVTPFWNGSIEGIEKEGYFSTALRLFLAPIQLAKLVKKNHYDVVHINPSLTYKSVIRDSILLISLRMVGFKKTLFYIHGWEQAVADNIAKLPLIKQLFVWLLNGTGRVMVLSPDFKQSLEQMGVLSHKVVATRTMFDGEYFKKHLESQDSPIQKRRSILFMSRFVVDKGVYQLVHAFANLAKDFPDVDVIMAGDGEENNGLQKEVSALGLGERIKFTGYVGGSTKAKLLNDCYIYALPTYMTGEGMPIALLEAMAAGKPIITGTAGAIKYIVSDPKNGVVLDTVTISSVETGLRRLLEDSGYCIECGKRNKIYAWREFEAKQVVTQEIEKQYNLISSAI